MTIAELKMLVKQRRNMRGYDEQRDGTPTGMILNCARLGAVGWQ